MNPLWKILLFVIAVALCGIVISPLAYWICHWLVGHGWLTFLEGYPFHRYFSRTIQVSALILVFPLIWWLRIRSLDGLGLSRNPLRWRDLGAGVACAVLPFVALAGVGVLAGWYQPREEVAWSVLPRILGTAAAVSLIEEFLFRGVLMGLAVRAMGAAGGLTFSAVIFAGMHFVRPARLPDEGPVTWLSGLEQAGTIFADLPDAPLLAGGMVTLLVVGFILGGAVLWTRSLWLAIGAHAGWILCQQTFNLLVRFGIEPPLAAFPWIGPNVVFGMVPTGVAPLSALGVSALLVWAYVRTGRSKPDAAVAAVVR